MKSQHPLKAMILAAGLGSRMRPLTLTTPKPLLQVGDKPLIVWHIEKLKALGIVDIVINAAYLKDVLVASLGDGRELGVNIQWSLEEDCLETAGGIIQALPKLGDAPFMLINGDIWTRFDFSQIQAIDLKHNLAHLCLVDNPPQHPNGDFYLSGNRVFENASAHHGEGQFVEQTPGEMLTFAGISLLSPRLFAGLAAGKRPLAPLLREAMRNGLVSGQKIHEAWVDVGTPERLNALDQHIRAHQI